MSYFIRHSDFEYAATPHVGGAWNSEEQHIAPVLGLMAHVAQREAVRAGTAFPHPVRLSFDILGVLPVGPVSLETQVLRPGRSIELMEVVLSGPDRAAVRMRAWFMGEYDTSEICGTEFPALEAPETMENWDGSSQWPGNFIASLEGRRRGFAPGRGHGWLRTDHRLVENEEVSEFAQFCALLDTANGIAVRADPSKVFFPNLDLTASFFRTPVAGWVGYDTTVSYGNTGWGLTHSVVHDINGPVAAVTQSLTVRTA